MDASRGMNFLGLEVEVLVGGSGGSAKNSGTVKFEMSEASGGVCICVADYRPYRLRHGNRR